MTRNSKLSVVFTGLAILGIVVWIIPALGAVDMFIKIEGVNGESTDRDHQGWIEVQSFSWGSSGGAEPRGVSAPDPGAPGSLSITKFMDKASPSLLRACLTGGSLGDAEVHWMQTSPGRNDYPVYFLRNVTLSSCGGSGGEDRPTENVTLNFSKIDIEYRPFDRGGRGRGTGRDPFSIAGNGGLVSTAPVAPPAGSTLQAAGYAFPGGTISGMVLDPAQTPVPNVPVSVATLSGIVVETQTGPQGRFTSGVPHGTEGELTFSLRDVATGAAVPAVIQVVTRVPEDIPSEPRRWLASGDAVDIVGNYPDVALENPRFVAGSRGRGRRVTRSATPDGEPTPAPADVLAETGRLSLPTMTSVGPGGSPAITRYVLPVSVPPTQLVTVMTASDGRVERFDTTTYTATGRLDTNQLRSGQATDFTFDFRFPAGSVEEIGVRIDVTGAIRYEQAGEVQRLRVAPDGSAQLVGTVNAATPGGLPFTITPTLVP